MTPPRTGRHDREHIVETALTLLDRVGLPDLTMRRLAAELDVQPSALYWHVRNKQELLAAVADRILDRVRIPEAGQGDLQQRLLATARGIRDALLAYRDGAEVVLSTEALRLGSSRALGALATVFRADCSPADDARARIAAAAVLQFILGHTTLVQQQMHAESHGAATPPAGVEPGPAPEEEGSPSSFEVFDAGVRMLARGFSLATDSRV
ncbi:AcrR family transcriptional regulator [Microbacterium resistens]|uniref:AcrR family transcriptional regulator n=1 Tax=Microbacterium resistens TaxID=156977 RepID=A0ABU1SH16_9MICO|nr:TetR family transcriptional regulator [Microbacterium resistens]MDR6868268.1 AcrR family transcriptional regulator [Microbacterium resistens]